MGVRLKSRKFLWLAVLTVLSWGLALSGMAWAQTTPHLIVVFIDGPRYSESFAEPMRIPRIWNDLRPQGSVLTAFRNDGWTLTVSGHSTTLCGRHQYLANNGTERPHDPTLFERYRKQTGAPAADAWVVAGKAKLAVLAYSDSPDGGVAYAARDSVGLSTDTATMDAVLGVLARDHPRVMAVNLPQVDIRAHSLDWNGYLAAISGADSLVGVLWDFLQSDPEFAGRSTLVVTADHGRHDNRPTELHNGFQNHGDACNGCRHILLAAAGVGIRAGTEIAVSHNQTDLGATLGKLLGLDLTGIEGFPIYEMLTAPTATPGARPGGLRILAVRPHPFQVGGGILLALRPGTTYHLGIYDLHGRLVREFVGHPQDDTDFVPWDGRDSRGRNVASGVYRLRLWNATGQDQRSLTLLR